MAVLDVVSVTLVKEEKTIEIWEFSSEKLRRALNINTAKLVGKARNYNELVNIRAYNRGYLAFRNPQKEEWLLYFEALKFFKETEIETCSN